PVQGPAATGLAAVQQYFEALGLAKPPRVEIADPQVNLRGHPGQTLRHHLLLRTTEKRPVYAHGVSDQPWLEVGNAQLSGTAALRPLQVPAVPDRAGQVVDATVSVTANGGQHFVVPVSLTILEPLPPSSPLAVTTVPVDTSVLPTVPVRPKPPEERRSRWWGLWL